MIIESVNMPSTWANNAGSLAWGINRVLSDPKLAARLRRAGRREVRQRYGWDSIAERTREVYEEVMADATRASARATRPAAEPGVRPRYLSAGAEYSRS